MSKAVICPVCNGEGRICEGIVKDSNSAEPITKPCHGCNGKGWVEIGQDIIDNPPPVYPFYPYYPPYPNYPVWTAAACIGRDN